MKSYTDLEQSKKLAETLPLESADMWYHGHSSSWESERKYDNDACPFHSMSPNWDKPCWSLAALLGVLPNGTKLSKSTNISSIGDTKYHCDCPKGNIDVWFDNPVDACVEMIEKLHEQNIL